MFSYLIESGICLAIFYAGYWLFLRNETFFSWNRLYLILSLGAAFLIPLFNITSPFRTVILAGDPGADLPLIGTESSSAGAVTLLLAIYLTGMMFFLIRFLAQLLKLARTVHTCRVHKDRDCRLVLVEKDIPPFSFFRYIFLNRGELSATDLERIKTHELVHIKQRHSLDALIMELVTIIQWFNPFVWPYKKSLKEIHEYLADDGVIAQGCSATGYKLLILEQHVGGKLIEWANNFRHSQIKRRITMMAKNKSRGRAKLKILMALPLAVVLTLAFAEPEVVKAPAMEDEAAAPFAPMVGDVTTAGEQEKTEEQKKKELELKLIQIAREREAQEHRLQQMAELEAKLKETEDPEKRKMLKAKLEELKQQELLAHQGDSQRKQRAAQIKELEMALKASEDAEKREQLKARLIELRLREEKAQQQAQAQQRQKALEKQRQEKIKLLEMKLKQTEDPDTQERIQHELQELLSAEPRNQRKDHEVKTISALRELEVKMQAEEDAQERQRLQQEILKQKQLLELIKAKQRQEQIKMLEKKLAETQDPDKRKEIKLRLEKLKNEKAVIKNPA